MGGPVHTLGPCGSLQQPLLWGSPAAAPTPSGVFNQRFEALFPRAGALGCVVCFAPSCLSGLCVRECGAIGSASARTACAVCPTLHQSRSHHGHVSPLSSGACLCPSYRSGWMFIFYFLGVGPPCRLIICQFWLCEEAQCVYLCRHLGSPVRLFLTSMSLVIFCLLFSSIAYVPVKGEIIFYAAKRKKELIPFATAWMELESIMLSEISQVGRDKYHRKQCFLLQCTLRSPDSIWWFGYGQWKPAVGTI